MNTDLARQASIFSTASTVSICMMLPKAHDQGWHLLGAPSHHILLVLSHLLPLIAYHIAGTHLCPCFWVDLSWSNTLVPVGHLLLEGQICPAASCAQRFHIVNLGPKRNKCTSRCLGTMTWGHHDCKTSANRHVSPMSLPVRLVVMRILRSIVVHSSQAHDLQQWHSHWTMVEKMLDATVSDGNYSHRNLMFVSVQLVASRDGNAADPAQAWIARCLVWWGPQHSDMGTLW